MKEAKKDAESKRAELLEKAQAESQSVFAAGKKQLEAEKIKMLDDAKKELVSMVVSATEKVLGTGCRRKSGDTARRREHQTDMKIEPKNLAEVLLETARRFQ